MRTLWARTIGRRDQRCLVEHVSLNEFDSEQKVFDTLHRAHAGPASHPDYAGPLLKQEYSRPVQ
jgi:hypothetical protein